jgi:hypothetical protein
LWYAVPDHQGNRKDQAAMAKTHTNPFTKEQMEQLRTNHYVKSVSPSTVRFTEEFKKYYYHKHNSGVSSRQIFLECGIDPDILGQSRIDGFRYTVNKHAKRDEGFCDNRQSNYRRPSKSGDETVETRIRQLEHELAYTRQEVEFLKKLQMADMEARRQWESRHQPK